MICSTSGCRNGATHLLARDRHASNTGFHDYAYVGYRSVCKECGKKGSLDGYHLVKN